jgi:transcriptional regulator with XRE-family HTH domain
MIARENSREVRRRFRVNLSDLKRSQGMTQVIMSRRTGISQPNISTYLRGKATPHLEHLVALSRLFCVSAGYFVEHIPEGEQA